MQLSPMLAALPALAALPIASARAQDPAPLVALSADAPSADDPSAGTPTWKNGGSLGDFTRVGSPQAGDD